MKKLLITFLLFPVVCFATMQFTNVDFDNRVIVGDIPRILFIGDSITAGGVYSYTNDSGTFLSVGGYRHLLSEMLGGWANFIVGDVVQTDMRPYDQARCFAWPGGTTSGVLDAAISYNGHSQHETWLNVGDNNLVVVMLGTNNANTLGGAGPDNATEDAAIADISDYIDDMEAYKPSISMLISTIAPITDTNKNAWAVSFNSKLITMVANKAKTNIATVDIYTPLSACWDAATDECNADDLHPNNAGHAIIAGEMYNIIKSESFL